MLTGMRSVDDEKEEGETCHSLGDHDVPYHAKGSCRSYVHLEICQSHVHEPKRAAASNEQHPPAPADCALGKAS